MQVTIHQAKARLSKLIAAAERGEEIIITRRNMPVAGLGRIEEDSDKTWIGGLKGKKFKMAAKFDDPALNVEIASTFYNPWPAPPSDGMEFSHQRATSF